MKAKFVVIFRPTSLLLSLLATFASLSPCPAALDLPTGLTRQEQLESLSILAPSTRPKVLADPYPLGGYSGFEVGVSYQEINTAELSLLGTTPSSQNNIAFPTLVIGKGLYHDVDLFLITLPFFNELGLTQYGANVRWSFYHSQDLPTLLTLSINANSTNLDNQLIIQNVGYELVASIYVPHFTLYLGIAPTLSSALALGSSSITSVTASQQIEQTSIAIHPVFTGVTFRYRDFFWTLQIDGSDRPIYTTRLGVRL